MARIRSPIRWLGGKSQLVKKILPLFPVHDTYIEPFGGGGSLLLSKDPSPTEVYNDLDSRLYTLFHVLSRPEWFKEFLDIVSLVPFSREERRVARLNGVVDDPIEEAVRTFILARQSFGGMIDKTAWGLVSGTSVRGMAQSSHQWWSTIARLREVHNRLLNVLISNKDWRDLSHLDGKKTLWYLDPPYVPSTRRDGRYTHEMSMEDHKEFIKTISGYSGMVILSGYPNKVYEVLEDTWVRMDFSVKCFVVARTKASGYKGDGSMKNQGREECIWLNPATVEVLENI